MQIGARTARSFVGACLALLWSTACAGPSDVQPAAGQPAQSMSADAERASSEFVEPLGRPGDGRPVCGLGREFHAGRRAELRRRRGEGLILVRGLPETRDYKTFRQDKAFWYLTGIESPGADLLMDAATGLEVLFLPERSRARESVDGEMWDASDEWVAELTGFRTIRPSQELTGMLEELAADRGVVHTPLLPWAGLADCYDRALPFHQRQLGDPFDGRLSRERQLAQVLKDGYGVEVEDLSPAISAMRQVKTPEELAALRRAADAGAFAMREAMRSSRAGLGEWDLRAVMELVQRRHGSDGPAYDAIVGSGPNSIVLHYMASSRRMAAGDMICLDFGPELDHYTTDITRSWPVDGHFTPRIAELYDAVLAAQAAGIAAVRPGRSILDIEQACNAVLIERGFGQLIRHGNCHWVGMEVHDVGDYLADFEPGMVFTIEPGLYDAQANIGIRIEDVVVVTEDGCEVITARVPKAREEVVALIGETGVLDWMDG
jgi:Xaa-Pro aminopeptidase